jgi:toxin YoeB
VSKVVFDPNALEDLRWWVTHDRRAASKVLELVQEVLRDPFSGRGKPEPLKFQLSGCWSRRLTLEHRLVYEVTESRIRILACRYHYREPGA